MTARRWLLPALLALVLVLAVLSVLVGKFTLTWDSWAHQDEVTRIIFLELRVPRALLAVIIGGALGLAGAAMQAYLRNPLADPGTLGISSMAAFGAVLSIFLGIADLNPWVLPITGVLGGVLGMTALFTLSGLTGSVLTLVLAGILLSSLSVAGISLLLALSPSPWAAGEIVHWILGSLADHGVDDLTFVTPFVVLGSLAIYNCRQALDALTLGETGARSLGIDLQRVQWQLCGGVGLIVGASVAISGVIGFVGLVVPHLMRPLVGSRPAALLIPSALGGAVLLLAGDIVVRLLPGGSELQLGVVMSQVGAPFFFMLLYSLRRRTV